MMHLGMKGDGPCYHIVYGEVKKRNIKRLTLLNVRSWTGTWIKNKSPRVFNQDDRLNKVEENK